MTKDEIAHKGWRIDILSHAGGWKALVYRPGSNIVEAMFPNYPNRNEVIDEAKMFIDEWYKAPK